MTPTDTPIDCDRCLPGEHGERIDVRTWGQSPCEHTQTAPPFRLWWIAGRSCQRHGGFWPRRSDAGECIECFAEREGLSD